MIKLWINHITKLEYEPYMYDGINDQPKTVWTFKGDGDGDAEGWDHEATEQVLKDYISDCKVQIKLAEEYLETKIYKE